jgi:hypothetical protein
LVEVVDSMKLIAAAETERDRVMRALQESEQKVGHPIALTWEGGCAFRSLYCPSRGCPDSSITGVCENIRDTCGYLSHP